jgi:hypothetical protein
MVQRGLRAPLSGGSGRSLLLALPLVVLLLGLALVLLGGDDRDPSAFRASAGAQAGRPALNLGDQAGLLTTDIDYSGNDGVAPTRASELTSTASAGAMDDAGAIRATAEPEVDAFVLVNEVLSASAATPTAGAASHVATGTSTAASSSTATISPASLSPGATATSTAATVTATPTAAGAPAATPTSEVAPTATAAPTATETPAPLLSPTPSSTSIPSAATATSTPPPPTPTSTPQPTATATVFVPSGPASVNYVPMNVTPGIDATFSASVANFPPNTTLTFRAFNRILASEVTTGADGSGSGPVSVPSRAEFCAWFAGVGTGYGQDEAVFASGGGREASQEVTFVMPSCP